MAPSEGRGGAATKPPPPGGGRLASLAAVSRPPMLVEHVEHARVGGDIELAREVRARGEQPVVVLARERVRMGGAVRERREAAVVPPDDERRGAEQHAGEKRLAAGRRVSTRRTEPSRASAGLASRSASMSARGRSG